jgi:hypothetical protein
MGFSLEGKGSHHPNDHSRRMVTSIHRMTIAPIPKGFDQTLQIGRPLPALGLVAKALVESIDADELEWAGDLYSTTVDLGECRWVKAADAPVVGDMLNQDQAHYRPDGSEWACRNCAHWDDDHCDKVQGTVRAEGNCDYFELPKGTKSRAAGETSLVVVQVEAPTKKALTTGTGIVGEGDTGGKALRTQALDGGTRSTSYDGRRKRPSKAKVRRLVEKALVTGHHSLAWQTAGNVNVASSSHGHYGVAKSPLGGHMAYYKKAGTGDVQSLGHGQSADEAKNLCIEHHKTLTQGARPLARRA